MVARGPGTLVGELQSSMKLLVFRYVSSDVALEGESNGSRSRQDRSCVVLVDCSQTTFCYR